MTRLAAVLFVLAALTGGGAARAAGVSIEPSQDNTIYGESPGFSNGSGAHLFAGKTGSFHSRRALIAFDVAGSVPAGSTITEVSLTLYVSRTPNVATLDDHEFSLHRLLAGWGEGASSAPGPGGTGTDAAPGDATWIHRFFPIVAWNSAGGDFNPVGSASLDVGDVGYWEWETTSGLVADVQSWLDTPALNHGWILIGDEFDLQTARRFDSRNNPDPSVRPVLNVIYEPAAPAAGAVPDGDDVPGTPLRLAKGLGTSLSLSWSASCRAADVDYQIYEGDIGDFGGHEFVSCSTGGVTQAIVVPRIAPSYYLVVPTDLIVEGSYGRDSSNVERPQGITSCLAQLTGVPVCP